MSTTSCPKVGVALLAGEIIAFLSTFHNLVREGRGLGDVEEILRNAVAEHVLLNTTPDLLEEAQRERAGPT